MPIMWTSRDAAPATVTVRFARPSRKNKVVQRKMSGDSAMQQSRRAVPALLEIKNNKNRKLILTDRKSCGRVKKYAEDIQKQAECPLSPYGDSAGKRLHVQLFCTGTGTCLC